jgi:hypothetical protein
LNPQKGLPGAEVVDKAVGGAASPPTEGREGNEGVTADDADDAEKVGRAEKSSDGALATDVAGPHSLE